MYFGSYSSSNRIGRDNINGFLKEENSVLLHRVQNRSAEHRACYPVGTERFSPELIWPECEVSRLTNTKKHAQLQKMYDI